MLKINHDLTIKDLKNKLENFWKLSGEKILAIESENEDKGTPVFTVQGKYTSMSWTEWTQGFQYGSAVLQYDAIGDDQFLEIGRKNTFEKMANHVTHIGVHDHGFNNVSTYGSLLRLMKEGKIPFDSNEKAFYEMALKASGAVQASRWSTLDDQTGFIYSFNGPHSLFSDTIRSVRSLAIAYKLGHSLMGEKDKKINLLGRLFEHAANTAKFNVYYGEERDFYDLRGRVVHESIFNMNDGSYRCPSTQQGYCAFTTWTRGLAWIMVGYTEELEFLETLTDEEISDFGNRKDLESMLLKAAEASCDFYIESSPTDGMPYWDTGAPGLAKLEDYENKPADPYNEFEPVDSSAAAIGVQGLLRLGHYLKSKGQTKKGKHYWQAGLTVMNRLMEEPYLSSEKNHQGLILHSVYHRPNNWDYIPTGQKVPCGESSMWGDYHAREAALYLQKILNNETYYTYFGAV